MATTTKDRPSGREARSRDGGRSERNGAAGRSSFRLEPVVWEEWLGTCRDRDLVFRYQEKPRHGSDSNFFGLDSPKREEG